LYALVAAALLRGIPAVEDDGRGTAKTVWIIASVTAPALLLWAAIFFADAVGSSASMYWIRCGPKLIVAACVAHVCLAAAMLRLAMMDHVAHVSLVGAPDFLGLGTGATAAAILAATPAAASIAGLSWIDLATASGRLWVPWWLGRRPDKGQRGGGGGGKRRTACNAVASVGLRICDVLSRVAHLALAALVFPDAEDAVAYATGTVALLLFADGLASCCARCSAAGRDAAQRDAQRDAAQRSKGDTAHRDASGRGNPGGDGGAPPDAALPPSQASDGCGRFLSTAALLFFFSRSPLWDGNRAARGCIFLVRLLEWTSLVALVAAVGKTRTGVTMGPFLATGSIDLLLVELNLLLLGQCIATFSRPGHDRSGA
jgi:hypothetical protein